MEVFSTLVLVCLVAALLAYAWRGKRGVRLPPGPTPLPLLGNLLQVDKRAPFKSFLKLSERYGPVLTMYIGPQRTVVLVGYEVVKEALLDQGDDFSARAPFPFLHRVVRGHGLAISNGEPWRQLRRFTLTTLRDFGMGRRRMEEWIREESKYLMDSMTNTHSAPFDPAPFLSRTVSNVICALVFGRRFEYEDHSFLRLLEIISETLRFTSSPWGQMYNVFPWLMERLPGSHHSTFARVDKLGEFVKERIQEHKATLSSDCPRDYIDCFLIRLNKESDNPETAFNDNNMVATLFNLFLAGTETTSTTLRYALMMLIKNPKIQERVQLEIDTRVLDLLLPHYSVFPKGYATKDITFKGYTIPKGTVILPMLHSVLRDEKQWATPWAFNPGHFLDENDNFKKSPAFMVFSAGKRSCVGESLARMEIFLFLVSMLQHFTFTCPGGPESLDSTPEFSSFASLPHRFKLIATPH
ncbi:hypothetical protein AAFF_G00338950 [Aldrovandia affinis]|uniref:Cytochrome P450 n=1 Tax=Aldrovandia affinis TaxID=143900 RepID=A0AAD7R6L8_9TELE|nr:hypothetical protein AAFF_G00338950 [Aldrovandia affinis]